MRRNFGFFFPLTLLEPVSCHLPRLIDTEGYHTMWHSAMVTTLSWLLRWLWVVSNWISPRSAAWFPGLIEVWIILLEQLTAAVSNCPRQHQPPTLDLLFELLRDVTKTPGKNFYVCLLRGVVIHKTFFRKVFPCACPFHSSTPRLGTEPPA